MSQIEQDISPTASARSPARRPACMLLFVAAYVIVLSLLLALSRVIFLISPSIGFPVLTVCFLSCVGALAIGPSLLVLASKRCMPAVLLLFASHAAILGTVYAVLWEFFPYDAENLFRRELFYFALVTVVLSAMFAFWVRRRHWRIEPESSDDADKARPPQGRIAPMVTLDYVFLLACIPLIWLMQKGSGEWPLILPISMVIVIVAQGFIWFAMRKTERGFFPGILLGAGLAFLYSIGVITFFFHREVGIAILLFSASPLSLWVGLLLSLRRDGYRWKRDFCAFVDKVPIAEPDPLA